MVHAVFPQEPPVTRSLSLLEQQSKVVAELGLLALRVRGAQPVMEAAVEAVASALDNDLCKVLELLPDGKAMLLRAGVGWRPGLVGQGTVSAGLESQAGFTLMEGGPVVVRDLPSETRFNGPPLLHNHGVVSGLSTPIYTSQGPWGVIGTHKTTSSEYSRHDQDFLVAVANVLGAAVERERYEQELDGARQRLQRWDHMRAQFVHNVAHELRTPLTPLVMQLQTLDRKGDLAPQVAEGVRIARRGAQRLQEMVDAFVELTSLQADALPLERRRLDLSVAAREVVEAFTPVAQGQEIGLHLEAEDGVWVEADPQKVRQVIRALVDNGVKFTREKGAVRVQVGRRGDFGMLSVEDEGVGLEPEQIQMLFQPFTQATMVEHPAAGLGVGLAIAKEIVELHGGHIEAESAGPGRGARIWFTIRLVEGERATERAGDPATDPMPRQRGQR